MRGDANTSSNVNKEEIINQGYNNRSSNVNENVVEENSKYGSELRRELIRRRGGRVW